MRTLGRLLLWTLGALVGMPLAVLALVLMGRGAIGLSHRWEHGARSGDRALPNHVAVTYYVSPDGDDTASGTTPDAAFRTVSPINALDLGPGDRVLLRGTARFTGPLLLDAEDVGTPRRPIQIASYGDGRAVIEAGSGTGVRVTNTGGVEIADLVVAGAGADANSGDGVLVENRLLGATRLRHVRVEDVEARGFGGFGVRVHAGPVSRLGIGLDWLLPPKSGYEDVRIEQVSAHGNGLGGIVVDGTFNLLWGGTYAHRSVYVGRCRAYRNIGRAGRDLPHTGSGIVVADVDGAVVERSVAFENGLRSESRLGGPVGIWTWDATRVAIRHNVSFRNRTAGRFDGGGFDLDGGVTHSVMEYNLSYDNDGSGFLLAQFPSAHPFHDNAVRYNVSIGDGRKNSTAGILVWSGDAESPVTRTEVAHNTILQEPSEAGTPSALLIRPESVNGLVARANVFAATGAVPLVTLKPGQQGVDLRGNVWAADTLLVEWGEARLGADAFLAALGDSEAAVQTPDALRLAGPLGADSLGAYLPLAGSPLLDAASETGAERDIRGTPVPQGTAPDIGAIERPAESTP